MTLVLVVLANTQSTRTTGILGVVALVLAVIGTGRPPLVSDRWWRFLCWMAAAEVGLFAWNPTAILHIALAVATPIVLALLFSVEARRELVDHWALAGGTHWLVSRLQGRAARRPHPSDPGPRIETDGIRSRVRFRSRQFAAALAKVSDELTRNKKALVTTAGRAEYWPPLEDALVWDRYAQATPEIRTSDYVPVPVREAVEDASDEVKRTRWSDLEPMTGPSETVTASRPRSSPASRGGSSSTNA